MLIRAYPNKNTSEYCIMLFFYSKFVGKITL